MITESLDFKNLGQSEAVMNVLSERERQDSLFGEQDHDPAWWLALMVKQVGDASKAIIQSRWGNRERGLAKAREELVQVAAVALAAIEAIDRGNLRDDIQGATPASRRQLAKSLGLGHEAMNYDRYEPEDSEF